MAHLDVAYSFVRHVTSPLVDSFLAELAQQLAELNPENFDTGVAAPTTSIVTPVGSCRSRSPCGDPPLAPPRPVFGGVSGVSASLGAVPMEHAHTFADGSPPSSPYSDVAIVPGVPVGPVSDSALEHVHIISDLPGRGRSPARCGRRLPQVPRGAAPSPSRCGPLPAQLRTDVGCVPGVPVSFGPVPTDKHAAAPPPSMPSTPSSSMPRPPPDMNAMEVDHAALQGSSAGPATAGSSPAAPVSAGATIAMPRATIPSSGEPPSTFTAPPPSMPSTPSSSMPRPPPDMNAMEVDFAALQGIPAGPATTGSAPAAPACDGATHAMPHRLPPPQLMPRPLPVEFATESGHAAFVAAYQETLQRCQDRRLATAAPTTSSCGPPLAPLRTDFGVVPGVPVSLGAVPMGRAFTLTDLDSFLSELAQNTAECGHAAFVEHLAGAGPVAPATAAATSVPVNTLDYLLPAAGPAPAAPAGDAPAQALRTLLRDLASDLAAAAAEQHWPRLHRPPPVRPLLTAARKALAQPAPAAPDHAGPAAGAALDGPANVQAFNSLLHDMSASFAEIAAMSAFAITYQYVHWSKDLQRAEIAFLYRVVAGVASPTHLLHIPRLITILANHLGLGPHFTLMVLDCA